MEPQFFGNSHNGVWRWGSDVTTLLYVSRVILETLWHGVPAAFMRVWSYSISNFKKDFIFSCLSLSRYNIYI